MVAEAFAEFTARSVQPISKGFTNFGFALPVVVGQWVKRGLDVPLVLLAKNHNRLSLKCMIQSYPERASFLFFLQKTFGKKAVVDFLYQTKPITIVTFEQAFGHELSDLASEWRDWVGDEFAAIPEAEGLGTKYLNETPAKYFPYCKSGTDY